ncbi:S1C family serine protease [Corynebacterium halotolerans]|uniref:S1C family serine protease n=1 Tax=Corynebacterium halotolerans TaxID=225326 RepID=UPI003CF7642C
MNNTTPNDPRNGSQGWGAGAPRENYEPVDSPYAGWGQSQQAPEQTTQSLPPQNSAVPPVAVDEEPRPKGKRTVGLGTALALIVAAAVAAGAITGVVVGNTSGSSGSEPVNSLSAPSADRGETAPAGSVEQVADQTLPSVVAIQVASRTAVGEGSGSIISSDGLVLTNHHVVSEAADGGGQIQVTLNDERTFAADYVASDPSTDIAVIKIRDVSDLPVIQFGDSDQLEVGQQVVAIGSPLGLTSTVTTGIVSAMNRPVRAAGGEGGESSLIDAVQTDAAINPGNSGGPLVDMEGNLIGMNSVIASLSSGSDTAGSIGLGFAIPSNFAKRVADQLVETGEATHPMIGVQVSATSPAEGALVASVEEDGPGAAAGLNEGDVITRMNDRKIDNSDELIAAVRSQDFGATVTLEVTRQGTDDTREVDVTLTGE